MSEVQSVDETTMSTCDELKAMVSSKTTNAPTKRDSKRFIELWIGYAEEVGVNEETVQLLFDGFQFGFGEPLYRYAKKSQEAYSSFQSTRAAGINDRGITLKVVLSLFAYELVESSGTDSLQTVARMIQKYARNNKGIVFGTINRPLPRILIQPLRGRVIAEGSHLSSGEAASILSVIRTPLEQRAKAGKTPKNEVDTIIGLLAWLDEQRDAGKADAAANERSVETSLTLSSESPEEGKTMGETSANQVQVSEQPKNETSSAAVEQVPVQPVADVEQVTQSSGTTANVVADSTTQVDLTSVIPTLLSFQKQYDELVAACKVLEEEKKQSSRHASMLEQRIKELVRGNTTLSEQVETLNMRCGERQSTIDKLSADNLRLEDELKAATELLDLGERDDKRQADEGMRRLASELKIEYEDYLDAVDLPMNVDLGENMRDQLAEVFKILKKFGIEL